MTSLFYADISLGQTISWESLIEEISEETSYSPICKNDSYYEVFKQLVISLLIGEKICLLDSDYPEGEVEKLLNCDEYKSKSINWEADHKLPSSKNDLISEIRKTKDSWKIDLYTSGTTGTPKKITHRFHSLTRNVKLGDHHKNDVWGLAYNPTHMAGIQVFFQAVLNGNSIIRLFALQNEDIFYQIKSNSITHISATPSFYKLLWPCNEVFSSVIRITSGGEKFSQTVINQLQSIFPNAKISNIYASTEIGALFSSENDTFSIPEKLVNLVKIENNELIVHRSLVEGSNNEEWFKTGDLVEITNDTPIQFKFVARDNEIINIGGYNVNPIEIEEILIQQEGIKDVIVFAKQNPVFGNILMCELVAIKNDISEKQLRSFLQSRVQEYKIPRIFKFVDKISKTRTGKTKRN